MIERSRDRLRLMWLAAADRGGFVQRALGQRRSRKVRASQNRYGTRIPWEIPVQLAASDFLREGDAVFDVGANIGGVAIAFARLVGPNGRVYAFEPNPALIPVIRADAAANGVSNIEVTECAVWLRSGEQMALYLDDSHYASASSLMSERAPARRSVSVRTITLDDFCSDRSVVPKLIKIDVEGVEREVLEGATRLLEAHSPVVICEYFPGSPLDRDPTVFLETRGYAFFDTNLYERVSRAWYAQHFARPPQVNVVAVPPRLQDAYGSPQIEPLDAAGGPLSFTLPQPGRYRVDVELEGPDDDVAALRLVTGSGEYLAYYQAPLHQLRQHSCSSLVFEVTEPTAVRCELTPQRPESKAVAISARPFRVQRLRN